MPYEGICSILSPGFKKFNSTDCKSLYLNTKAREVQNQFQASIGEVSTIVTHLDKSVQVGIF